MTPKQDLIESYKRVIKAEKQKHKILIAGLNKRLKQLETEEANGRS